VTVERAGAALNDALLAVASGPVDPLVVMRRVADHSLALIPAADGAALQLLRRDKLIFVCAAGHLRCKNGLELPAHGSLGGRALRTDQAVMCGDTEIEERVVREAGRATGARSVLCAPLRHAGHVVGVLTLVSRRVDAFTHDDVALVMTVAGFIGDAIAGWANLSRSAAAALPFEQAARRSAGATRSASATRSAGATPSPTLEPAVEKVRNFEESARAARFVSDVLASGGSEYQAVRRRIEAVLSGNAMTMQFQPIVDLKTNRLAGCEALARFAGANARSPEEWFREAHEVGLGAELQLAAVTQAFKHLPQLPDNIYLAVNVGPDIAALPELLALLKATDSRRIVVELTEHNQVTDYSVLLDAVGNLRDTGARLATDDTGAGYAGFSHILKIAPDIIKLDRVLTTGIDSDPARQALAGALVNFAIATKASVVAEGIETRAELDVVQLLGIGFGQGYFLGRPTTANRLRTKSLSSTL
jgi:EAL domain-containing protein (putative c-di-GMP-specific phosphodiesterase class I)/putative methionine-R-sulfoxide reductase with GAF domain